MKASIWAVTSWLIAQFFVGLVIMVNVTATLRDRVEVLETQYQHVWEHSVGINLDLPHPHKE